MALNEKPLVRSISVGGNEPPPLPPPIEPVRSTSDRQVSLPGLGLQSGLICASCGARADASQGDSEVCRYCENVLVEVDIESDVFSETSMDDVSMSSHEPPIEVVHQIDLDLPRTHSGNPIVKARISQIRKILLRQAIADPELGYCQGMNFVAASFAFCYQSEDRAYKRFHSFVQRVRGLWVVSFPLLVKGTEHFELLARSRPWFQHLVQQDVDTQTYLPQQWMTLFAVWLPLPTLEVCIEFFQCEGFAAMLAMSLALFDHIGPILLTMNQECLLEAFSVSGLVTLRRHLPDAPTLARTVGAWLPTVFADLEHTLEDRVDPTTFKVELTRQGSRVVSPAHRDNFGFTAFFENLSDFAEEANTSLMEAASSLKKARDDTAEMALKKAGEILLGRTTRNNASKTGKALFNSLITRGRGKKKPRTKRYWTCLKCGEENRCHRTQCNNCGGSASECDANFVAT